MGHSYYLNPSILGVANSRVSTTFSLSTTTPFPFSFSLLKRTVALTRNIL